MARRQGTTRVPVAMPQMETAPELWLRNIRLSGFAFTVLGLIVLAVIVLAPSLRILVEQQQQIAELRSAVEQKKNAVDDLEDDVTRWDDPAYIESQARDRLNYVFPRDYTYLIVDDGEVVSASDGAPISAEIQETQVDWTRSLISSLFTAGLTDATAEELASPTFGDK